MPAHSTIAKSMHKGYLPKKDLSPPNTTSMPVQHTKLQSDINISSGHKTPYITISSSILCCCLIICSFIRSQSAWLRICSYMPY